MSIGTRLRTIITRSASLLDSRRRFFPNRFDVGGPIARGTGIAFVSADTITDSNNGLGVFTVGQDIRVVGSPTNSRRFKVVTVSAGTVTVIPAIVTAESAGPEIFIRQV